jgi:TonB family protein
MFTRTLALLTLSAAIAAPAAAQNNPLVAARELYASARYDEALAMLNGLSPTDSPNLAERRYVEQYRSLCLLALGRGGEAEKAIAAVVTADPSYQPSEAEASPRVRTAFTDVRQRLLPDITRARYTEAKAAFDRKDYASAEAQFRNVLQLIDDPAMGGRLADLRVLVTGFLDLTVAAAAPAPPPPPSTPTPTRPDDAPMPSRPSPSPMSPMSPGPAQAAPSPLSPVPTAGRIYSPDDEGVVAPGVIKQELPKVPAQVARQTRDRGLLEVIIDEQGRVVNATIRSPIHPVYDSLLLMAARDWKYKPATLNGQPIKFRKVIQVAVTR